MPGVKLYFGEDFSVLFGCPPEIIKILMRKNFTVPEYIVLPDTRHKNGIVQNSTEFPLYYFLFIMNKFKDGKKLSILGNKNDVESNRELLRLCLLGPTPNEYYAVGAGRFYKYLYKESRYLSVKNPEGKEYLIDDFIESISFNNDVIENDKFLLDHIAENVYKINNEIIDINFNEIQNPLFDIKNSLTSQLPAKFGIDILGGGSGFSPNMPCSGLLLNYNSDYMLLDCIPYIDLLLKIKGISKQQIKSVFLSHIHDDHCSMLPLLLFNNKIKFLSTKEIYWMALKKLSLQIGHDIGELYSYFDFVELFPYEKNEFYGMTIVPHYTVHSIPTIGAKFKMKERDLTHTIVFVGDNKSMPDIQKMVNKGITPKWKYEYLEKIYSNKYSLLIPDGGMGILHGDPRDSIESTSDRVVFLHLDNLPEKFNATFSLAKNGKRYILSEHTDNAHYAFVVRIIQIFHNHFPDISDEWITAMMNNIRIIHHNTDDVIMKQGEVKRDSLFIILSGSCVVKKHDGEKFRTLAVKDAGDFIGELAVISDEIKREASVIATTPVTLCEISEKIFYSFLEVENKVLYVKRLWSLRSMIEKFSPFSEFSDSLNERIVMVSKARDYKAGDTVITQGDDSTHFYIVLNGLLEVVRDKTVIDVLKNGDIFGEFGILLEKTRNASVVAKEYSTIIEIEKSDISKIIFSTPILNLYVHNLMHKRLSDGSIK